MVSTRKFSQFVEGTIEQSVGLKGGANAIGNTGDLVPNERVIKTIIQDTSALIEGGWVRFDNVSQIYVLALANSPQNAEVAGVVLRIIDLNSFVLQQAGYIDSGTPGFNGFSTSGIYFLSDTQPGIGMLTPPTQNGAVRLPVFQADSADSGWVMNLKSGILLGAPMPIGPGGGAADESQIVDINQPGNTFGIGDWVRVIANNFYSLANAQTFQNSQSVGVVIKSGNPSFTIQFSGYNSNTVTNAVDFAGNPIPIVAGTTYYLSDVIGQEGKITPTPPTARGTAVKPCFISISPQNSTGYVLPQQPLENKNIGQNGNFVLLAYQAAAGLSTISFDNVFSSQYPIFQIILNDMTVIPNRPLPTTLGLQLGNGSIYYNSYLTVSSDRGGGYFSYIPLTTINVTNSSNGCPSSSITNIFNPNNPKTRTSSLTQSGASNLLRGNTVNLLSAECNIVGATPSARIISFYGNFSGGTIYILGQNLPL